MDRLTKRVGVDEAVLTDEFAGFDVCKAWTRCCTGVMKHSDGKYGWQRHCNDECVLGRLIDRLATYEDICFDGDEGRITLDRLRELVEADRNGQLKKFPCKVGDTVYVIASCAEIEKSIDNDYFNGTGAVECPFEFSCDTEECDDGRIRIFKTTCTGFMVDENNKWLTFFYGLNIDDGYDCWGKTVFLALADAEKALKGVIGDA